MPCIQTKRTGDCTSPLQECPAKIPKIAVQDDSIELTVSQAVSGEKIVQLKISQKSSVAELKKSVEEYVEPGKFIKNLLNDGTELNSASILGAVLENGAEIQAIFGSRPTLFLANPSCADDFGSDGESDIESDDENWGASPIQNISKAPEVARDVANAMMVAAPNLGDFYLIQTESGECDGQVIVIAHPGDDTKLACLRALKTPKVLECCDHLTTDEEGDQEPHMPKVWSRAELKKTNWSKESKIGYFEAEDEREKSQLLAITKIMAEKLEQHFVFGFTEDIVQAPHIWGGYASDGSIVGVKATRVWT